MSGEYVYNLENLTKQQGAKIILDDITLSFFFGARIGVIGSNGSGKSSLLRIMAGIDNEFIGSCLKAKNLEVGYLEQEPNLDNTKTVTEVVMDGVKNQKIKLDLSLIHI